jgi:triphosphatase
MAHRAQAAAAVQSPRYTRLMLSLERWLLEAGWREQMPQWKRARLESPLRRFAGKELARSQRRLLKRGAKLPGADAPARHRVRIAAKKARYAMEFFEPLYPRRQVRHYVGALSGLQDELGRLNDATVADGLLLELAGTRTELAPAAGYARGYLASTVEHAQPALRKQWKRFSKLPLPRGAH